MKLNILFFFYFRYAQYNPFMKDNEKTRIISYDTSTNKIICGCKHSNFTGYPCRHEIAVIIKKSVPFECSNINPRWYLINL